MFHFSNQERTQEIVMGMSLRLYLITYEKQDHLQRLKPPSVIRVRVSIRGQNLQIQCESFKGIRVFKFDRFRPEKVEKLKVRFRGPRFHFAILRH